MYQIQGINPKAIAVLIASLALAACGGGGDDNNSSTTTTTTSTSSSSAATSSAASSAATSSAASSAATSSAASSAASSTASSAASSSAASSASSSAASSAASSSAASSSAASSASSSSAASIAWNVYNASLNPIVANSVTLADGTASTFTQGTTSGSTASTDFTAASGITTFNTTAATANKDTVYIASGVPTAYPKTFTLLAYVKINDTTSTYRGIELDMNTGSERVKGVIYNDGNGFGIEKVADSTATIKDGGSYGATGSYHVFQYAVNLTAACTGTVSLWVDGAAVTLTSSATLTAGSYSGNVITLGGSGCLTSTATGLYLGDGGSSAYNASIDWIVWTSAGAYSPSDVKGTLPTTMGTIPSNFQ